MRELVEALVTTEPFEVPQFIVLNDADCLLEIDAKSLLLLCQLNDMTGHQNISLVLVSEHMWHHFYPIHSPSLSPLCFTATQVKFEDVGEVLMNDLIGSDIDPKDFRAFINLMTSLMKHQFVEIPLMVNFIKQYYPIFCGGAPLLPQNINALYRKTQTEAKRLIRAESLQDHNNSVINSLSLVEKYLLIATFLGCHNPASSDTEIFSITASKKRKRVVAAKTKKAPKKKPISIRPCALERLLAIFYFIYKADRIAPNRSILLSALNRLTTLALISKITNIAKLSSIKFRSNFGSSYLSQLCKSVGFRHEHYIQHH